MLDYLCNGLRIFFHYMKSPDISPQLIRGICGRCRNAGIVQRASIGNCITYPKNIFGLFLNIGKPIIYPTPCGVMSTADAGCVMLTISADLFYQILHFASGNGPAFKWGTLTPDLQGNDWCYLDTSNLLTSHS